MIQLITDTIEIDKQRLGEVLDDYVTEMLAKIGKGNNVTLQQQAKLEQEIVKQMSLYFQENYPIEYFPDWDA